MSRVFTEDGKRLEEVLDERWQHGTAAARAGMRDNFRPERSYRCTAWAGGREVWVWVVSFTQNAQQSTFFGHLALPGGPINHGWHLLFVRSCIMHGTGR